MRALHYYFFFNNHPPLHYTIKQPLALISSIPRSSAHYHQEVGLSALSYHLQLLPVSNSITGDYNNKGEAFLIGRLFATHQRTHHHHHLHTNIHQPWPNLHPNQTRGMVHRQKSPKRRHQQPQIRWQVT